MADGLPFLLPHDDVVEDHLLQETQFLLPRDDVVEERLPQEVQQPNWRRSLFWHALSASGLLVAVAMFGVSWFDRKRVLIDTAVVNLDAETSLTPAPVPGPAVPSPDVNCTGFDPVKTCKWTLKTSCPGQKLGSAGKAQNSLDADTGYKCCCEQGLWKRGFQETDPCARWNPAENCKWTLTRSCPGQKWGTDGPAGISDSIGFQCCCEQHLFRQAFPNTVVTPAEKTSTTDPETPPSTAREHLRHQPGDTSTPECASMDCKWTLKWNCPGQTPGASGFAGSGGKKDMLGYKCCCEQGMWRTVPDPRPILFCFSLMWTSGYEPKLLKFQFEHRMSIFGCNLNAVYNGGSRSFNLGMGATGPVNTTAISDMPLPHEKGVYGRIVNGNKQTTNSWLSVPSWIRIWEQVRDGGLYKHADWTAKVDPDAVFFADRLRVHLMHFNVKKFVYIQNGNCFGGEFHFSGALEVFSYSALEKYLQGYPKCKEELPWQGWSEDYYMEYCMNWLEINYEKDYQLLSDSVSCRHSTTGCGDSAWVAFHPFKSVSAYAGCYNAALGRW